MAEAIFTREKIEKLAGENVPGFLTPFYTVLMRLSKDLLMSNCPCDACDWYWQYQQPE